MARAATIRHVPAAWASSTATLELLCSPRASADGIADALADRFGHLPRAAVMRADVRARELSAPRTALLTPSNTSCCMGGGFDAAIAARLGWHAGWPESAQPNPLQLLLLPPSLPSPPTPPTLRVGRAIAVPITPEASARGAAPGRPGTQGGLGGMRWLIAAPTMDLPAAPLGSAAPVRAAVRAAMAEARAVGAEHIVCPPFGTGWGALSPAAAAAAMLAGFEDAWGG